MCQESYFLSSQCLGASFLSPGCIALGLDTDRPAGGRVIPLDTLGPASCSRHLDPQPASLRSNLPSPLQLPVPRNRGYGSTHLECSHGLSLSFQVESLWGLAV